MRGTIFGALALAGATLAGAAPAMAAPPANDDFAAAQRVGIGVEYSGSLAEATPELGEPAHSRYGPVRSVWFRYRAPRSGRLTIDTGGSEFDTVLAVYRGSDPSNLHLVAADDDGSPSGNFGSTVRFKTKRGRVYRIAVDTFFDDQESYAFKLWLSDGGIKGKGVAMTVDPGQTVEAVRAHGLHLNVSARRKVKTDLALRVSRRTARRLGLEGRVLGRVSGPVDYGQSLRATIQLTPAARSALDGVEHLRARVRLTLKGSTAPDKALTVPVSL